jgi:hypothetical protein
LRCPLRSCQPQQDVRRPQGRAAMTAHAQQHVLSRHPEHSMLSAHPCHSSFQSPQQLHTLYQTLASDSPVLAALTRSG